MFYIEENSGRRKKGGKQKKSHSKNRFQFNICWSSPIDRTDRPTDQAACEAVVEFSSRTEGKLAKHMNINEKLSGSGERIRSASSPSSRTGWRQMYSLNNGTTQKKRLVKRYTLWLCKDKLPVDE